MGKTDKKKSRSNSNSSNSSNSSDSSSYKKKTSPHRRRDRNPFKERKTFYPPKENATHVPRRTKIVVKNSSPDNKDHNDNDTITLRKTTVLAVSVATISALSLFVTVLALLIVFSD